MYLYLLYITTLIVSLSGRISAASLADPDVSHETRYNAITADQRSPAEDPVKQVHGHDLHFRLFGLIMKEGLLVL